MTYDGPAPVVEGIFALSKNYAVDRGNGVVPAIDFYIQKWGFPEGFGTTDYEREIAAKTHQLLEIENDKAAECFGFAAPEPWLAEDITTSPTRCWLDQPVVQPHR